jgi:hypothetical protein
VVVVANTSQTRCYSASWKETYILTKYIRWFFNINIFQGFGTLCFAAGDVRLSGIRVWCVRWHEQQGMGSGPDRDTSRISASRLVLTFVTVDRLAAVEALASVFRVS